MAPFRLELTAAPGPLPTDTLIRVEYQGKYYYDEGKRYYGEKYDLRHPPTDNLDVCCRTGAPVTGKLPGVPCVGGQVKSELEGGHSEAGASLDAGSFSDARASTDAGPSARDAAASGDGGTPRESGTRSDGGAPEAILCELWTNGFAEIVVTGSGYAPLDETLDAERNDCTFVTRDVRIVWTPSDGGH